MSYVENRGRVRSARRAPTVEWTTTEERILVRFYPTMTAAELETLLPRHTRSAVRTRAHKLRIAKTPEFKREHQRRASRLGGPAAARARSRAGATPG